MATVYLGETPVNTSGNLPSTGSTAPAATLVNVDLSEVSVDQFRGKNLILNIFPSIDTATCAMSVRKFNEQAAALPDTIVLCISRDLPFAMKRFCASEGIANVMTVSDFRDGAFGNAYGVTLVDGALKGLHARAVVVVDKAGMVRYTQLVEKIGDEPDYNAALQAL